MFRKRCRIKIKKHIFKNKIFLFFVLFLIAGAGLFYLVIFSSFSQIKTVAVSGEKETNKEAVQSLVWQELEKSILFFKSRSVFLASLGNIQKKLYHAFPEIGRAEVAWKFPDIINIVIEERLGIARWQVQDRSFLISGEGIIFKEIYSNEKLIIIRDERHISPPVLGERIIEKDKLGKILEIRRKIEKDIKIGVEELIIFNERLNVKTIAGWEIYFDSEGDMDWQLTKLGLVLEKRIPLEERKNLEYVDLRFSRIFYKYKN